MKSKKFLIAILFQQFVLFSGAIGAVAATNLVGDGVTDNTTAINALLNTASATCATVFLPSPGIYVVQTIKIPGCVSLQIEGTLLLRSYHQSGFFGTLIQLELASHASLLGGGTIKMAESANAEYLILAAGDNKISDLTIDGNRYASCPKPARVVCSSILIAGSNVHILRNHIIHTTFSAITIPSLPNTEIDNTVVSDNIVSDTGGAFLNAVNQGLDYDPIRIRNLVIANNVYDTGVSRGTFGLYLDQVDNATITGNHGSAGPFALNLIAVANSKNVTIKNNSVQDSQAEAILLWGDVPGTIVTNNVISNNTVIRAGAIGIGIEDYTEIYDSMTPYSERKDHSLGQFSDNIVSDNTVIDADFLFSKNGSPPNYDVGIRLEGDVNFQNNVVINNSCVSTIVGASPARNGWRDCVGLDFKIPASLNTVYGNSISVKDQTTQFCSVRDLTFIDLGKIPVYSGPCTTSVWGLQSSGKIFQYNGYDGFNQIQGALTQISVGVDGTVWGLYGTQIWQYAGNNQWNLIPGSLTQIAVGNANAVWGLNGTAIYKYNGRGGWDLIPGGLTQIAVGSDGAVWGNSGRQTYQYAGNGRWNYLPVPGGLTQIAVGNAGAVWGLSGTKIYQYNGKGSWNLVPGALTQIAVGSDGAVWGLYYTQIWQFAGNNSWNLIPGGLTQISVANSSTIWGVSGTQIWQYRGNGMWSNIAGQLSVIDNR